MVVIVFQAILIKSPKIQTIAGVLESFSLIVFFYPILKSNINLATMVLFLIGVIFIVLSGRAGRNRMQNQIKIKFFRTSMTVLHLGVSGIAFIVVVLFVGALGSPTYTFTQNITNVTFIAIESATKQFIPTFSLDAKIGDIILDFASKDLSDEEKLQIESLPQDTKNKLNSQNSAAIQSQIDSFLGTDSSISNEETRRSIIDSISIWIKSLNSTAKSLLIFSGGLALWWILRLALWPLILVTVGVAYIVYQILLSSGTIKILLETRSREMLVM